MPELSLNEIYKNEFQISIEKHAKKKLSKYLKDNPEIHGTNNIPTSACKIFWKC